MSVNPVMSSSAPRWVLTTRRRSAVALVLTGYVFALTVRELLHPGHSKSGWLLDSGVLHGWYLVALNAFFYGCFCWAAFEWIRNTSGTERAFMAGWSAVFVLSPLKGLGPQWSIAISFIELTGLALSFLAALALFLTALMVKGNATSS